MANKPTLQDFKNYDYDLKNYWVDIHKAPGYAFKSDFDSLDEADVKRVYTHYLCCSYSGQSK